MIEAYLQSLLDTVTASPIVRASNVTLDKRTLRAGLIRGELVFRQRRLGPGIVLIRLEGLTPTSKAEGEAVKEKTSDRRSKWE